MVRRRLWLVSLVLIVVAALVPTPRVFLDDWTVSVVDSSGRGMRNVRVAQSWTHYSYLLNGGTERLSNGDGVVTFARVRCWRPLIYWIAVPIVLRVASMGHGSSGMSGVIRNIDPMFDTLDNSGATCRNDCSGRPLQAVIRVQRRLR
jgi:hypothetical protein